MIRPKPPVSKPAGLVRVGGRARFAAGLMALFPLLAACAHAPVRPAGRVPAPRGQEAILRAPDLTLTLSDGARIPVRIWPTQGAPRAVILALHGFGDSRDAWEWSAPLLTRAGLAVFAPDQRGFGAAPDRGGWAGAARMVQDAREEAAWLHTRFPGAPLYLMGESMGGAIALRVIETPAPAPIAGTILLSPAVWRLDAGARATLAALDALAPGWRFDSHNTPVHVVPSDNIAAMRRLYFDPLTLHGTRLHALHGLVELMAAAAQDASRARLPLLVIYGDADQLVPPEATAAFWRALPPLARRDLIAGGHHLLTRDRDGARVTHDIMSWVTDPDALLPSGGDSAAAAWCATGP